MKQKPLVFLHGWAQSQQIWHHQFEPFSDAQLLNLPGHGGAAEHPAENWVDALVAQLPDQACHLVGWSLGGMLAMQIASQYPERIAALTLVSTTPRFRIGDGWQHGSSEATFQGFSQAVASGSPKALSRFFALMLHGDEISRTAYNALAKAAVDRQNRVSQAGMQEGMALLQQLDLRELANSITQPTLVLHGNADAVVPVEAGAWLADKLHNANIQTFAHCGHAPFLTQSESFNQTLQTWWQQQ